MVNRIIIGANLGDEGKGTAVAHYTKNASGPVLNVLTNGGAQRAHSILTEDGSFTFQHFGSGTYHGADSYFSPYFILNPMQYVKEYQELTSRGVKIKKTYRHPDCRWSTPFDMMANQIKEQLRGTSKHGSCGMGIWETVQRYRLFISLPFDTFMEMAMPYRKDYLLSIKDWYERTLTIPSNWKDLWEDDGIVMHFLNDCQFLYDSTTTILDFSGYDETIYENGQGLLLCDLGYDIAGTTPSFTDSRHAMSLITDFSDVTIHYVTRPYLTRHGKGYLENEQLHGNISQDIQEDRTNFYNPFQDNFRFGELDIHAMHERILKDSHNCNAKIELDVTHCDEMDRVSEFKQLFNVVNTYDSALIK